MEKNTDNPLKFDINSKIKKKKPFKKKAQKKFKTILKKYRVKVDEEFKRPEISHSIRGRLKDIHYPLGTLGNISLVIGKAKSRKSFYMTYVLAALVSSEGNYNRFDSYLKSGQDLILYFDTEQGKYHTQLILKRVCELLGLSKPKNLHLYALRSLRPKSRLRLIEKAIYNTEKVGFVIIDGIRDLVSSINSEEESTEIASKLLKWTEERNIHIACVLHQNKGDTNARGHLGSELTHKAETVLSVTKSQEDKDVSVVEAVMCRNEEPEPFAFEILDGLPVEVEDFEQRTTKKRSKFDPYQLPDHKLYELLNKVYSTSNEYTYRLLVASLKNAHASIFNKTIGDNAAKSLLSHMELKGWLIQEKNRGPYKQGPFEKS